MRNFTTVNVNFRDADWDESDHDRAPNGEFATKSEALKALHSAHGVTAEHGVMHFNSEHPANGKTIREYLNQVGPVGAEHLLEARAKGQVLFSTPTANFNPNNSYSSDESLKDISDWNKTGAQLGSNPGGVYTSPDGDRYYVKQLRSKAHVESEVLANAIYEKLGVGTLKPEHALLEGRHVLASKLQKFDKFDKDNAAHVAAAREHAAAHAFLANWDAAGSHHDNHAFIDGKYSTLDAGATLKYNATGDVKSKFDHDVSEINENSLDKVFKGMKHSELENSVRPVAELTDKDIDDLVNTHLSDKNEAANISRILKSRRDNLVSRVRSMKKRDSRHTSFTVDVVLHRDFWSPQARAAAAEARKRRASAGAGVAAARAAYGRKDGATRLNAAVKAHGALHGAEHGKVFAAAAAAHTKRIAARRETTKNVVKGVRKSGGHLVKSMLRAHEETKIQ